MLRNKDPFARDKQAPLLAKHRAAHKPPTEAVDQRRLEVWRLRTDERMTVAQIAKQLSISTSVVYDDLNNQHDQILAALSEYGQLRRKEIERELEDFKAHCASYIFDPNVVIRGTKLVAGKERVVELSKFEAMVKIIPLYLAAMNIQSKMWGLYTVPEKARHDDAPGSVNIKNVSIHMVQQLRKIAQKEMPSVTVDNGVKQLEDQSQATPTQKRASV
jgi:predicted DNA-binding protein (UPF0251 family)